MAWHDVAGSAGAAMILVSYLLLQLGRMSGTGLSYSLLNGTGATLILVSLMIDFNLSAFIVEAFWLAISLIGIVRYVSGRTPAGS
ncbi:MAG: hypothetical protein OEV41_00245 [Gammaproteobacteria bacterium]|nr:hypothetical protein [Gammaproteobacteria bacterium]MDH5344524.1 hypothetical protein [Gammaproteobacteria bacterium]